MPTRFADWPRGLVWCAAATLLAAIVLALVASRGERTTFVPTLAEDDERAGADLKLHREAIARVGAGENHYEVYNERLRFWGFYIGSTFNWRLPTYTVLLGALPSLQWVQPLLAMLGLAGMCLAAAAVGRDVGFFQGAAAFVLQFGVFHWCLDGDAYLTPELWASFLILLSVSLSALGWHWSAVPLGLLALFFRELVLPYCAVAAVVAWYYGRRKEALIWMVGIATFFLFLGWHAWQVDLRLSPEDRAGSPGLGDWIVFGGFAFDVMTARMNAFLFSLPGWMVTLYLLTALIGLAGWRGEQGALVLWTTLAYLAAFAIVGKPMNTYWGLMYAPLLPFGVVRAPGAVVDLARALRGRNASSAMVETRVEQVE